MSLLIIFTWQWSFDCQAVGVNVCSFSLLKWLSAVSRTAVNLLIMSVCFNIIWLPPIYSFFSLELQLRHFIYCKFCVFVCKHGLKGQQIVPFLSFPFNSFPNPFAPIIWTICPFISRAPQMGPPFMKHIKYSLQLCWWMNQSVITGACVKQSSTMIT